MKLNKLKQKASSTGKHIGVHVLGYAVVQSSEVIGASIDFLQGDDNPLDQIPEKEDVVPAPLAETVDEEMSFSEAFSSAREELGSGGVFVWNNNAYATFNKEEWEAMTPEQLAEFRDSLNAAEAEHEELQGLDNDYGSEEITEVDEVETEVADATVSQDQVATEGDSSNVDEEVDEQPEITVELEEDFSEEDLAQIEADIDADTQLEIDQEETQTTETAQEETNTLASDVEEITAEPIEEDPSSELGDAEPIEVPSEEDTTETPQDEATNEEENIAQTEESSDNSNYELELDINQDGEIDVTATLDQNGEVGSLEFNQVDLDMESNDATEDPEVVTIDIDNDGEADFIGADLDQDGQVDYMVGNDMTVEDNDGDGVFETIEMNEMAVEEEEVNEEELAPGDDADIADEYYDEDFGEDYDNDADVSDMV